MMDILADACPEAYQTLYEAKPITCSVTCAAVLEVSQSTDLLYVTIDGDASIS